MSAQKFSELYNSIRDKLSDSYLNKKNKSELIDLIKLTSELIKTAELTIFTQSDALLKSSNELVKQCELNRNASEASPQIRVPQTYASKVSDSNIRPAFTTIVAPGNDSEQISHDEMKNLMETSLRDVKVNFARVSNQGKLVVNVPDENSLRIANEKLRESFPENFSIEAPKKILPKLMICNVPAITSESDFVSKVCEKDSMLRTMIQENETLEVVKIVTNKNGTDTSNRNFIVKCSAKVRHHLIDKSSGYIHLGLTRCRAIDHLYIVQCYHCQGYNHLARDCPDKDRDPVCGNCAGIHEIKACRTNVKTCVNCVRNKTKGDKHHHAASPNCPSLIREKSFLRERTDYGITKNH